ncbi:MAG TPA: AraC family transcriptional regulator, partial [Verrucomicrobiae bacterium]
LISKALGFIRDNLHRDISRDETARFAGISPSHFSRLLKERTGRSFTELLRQCRVDLACDLLRSTEKSLAQIADACGFCDQSYFTHVFQDVKGVTPKQFRDAGRANGSGG